MFSDFDQQLRYAGTEHSAEFEGLDPMSCVDDIKYPLLSKYFRDMRMFSDSDQLLSHARTEHSAEFKGLNDEGAQSTLHEATTRLSIGQSTNSKRACIPTYEIPSVITGRDGKHSLNALGDTCAIYNFMSPECAVSLGLNVHPTTSELVAIGSGACVKTTGVVATWYQFRDEPGIGYPLLFHILPNSVQDLILGRTFLKITETFTRTINRLRRVKKTVLKTLKQHRLLYLGDRAPKFLGMLNGTFIDALADTGSNVLIMDEDFARERGLLVIRGREHRTRLMFADGTTKMTSGVTRKVSWQFGPSPDSPKHLLEFHVLKNSPAPVILNDSLLFDTNAYEAYDCYLVDEEYESESDDEEAYLFHIGYDSSYDAQGKVDRNTIENKIYEEQERRNRADDELSNIKGDEKITAWDKEQELRSAFDSSIQALKDRQAAAKQVAQQTLMPPPDPHLPPSVLLPCKWKWYRFKWKRRNKPSIVP